MNYSGMQYIADFYKCSKRFLADPEKVQRVMLKAAHLANATIVESAFHHFSPQGVSGVVIISESHLTIHTWPEHGYAAVDLFSCGQLDFQAAFDHLKTELKAKELSVSTIKRGNLKGKEF